MTWRWRPRRQIRAIHDEDLASALRRLGRYDEMANGSAVCEFCGCTISFQSLQGLAKVDGRIVFFCDKSECTTAGMSLGLE